MRTTDDFSRLGAQLWVEKADSAERIDELIARAGSIGLTELRIFIMWPWLQSEPNGPFDFALYDAVFDSASAHNIKIKATLTANSGPWWTGAPDVLHTFTLTLDPENRAAMAAYVDATVARYANHPALGQWILWNEPINPINGKDGPPQRTAEARTTWERVIENRYDTIEALNERWRTGYYSFGEVPFLDEIVNPAHETSMWRSFAPRLDDFTLRETVLRDELRWLGDRVRVNDTRTELCVNPNGLFGNHADAGYRLKLLAKEVDTLGASFHAPWSFGYAPPRTHLALTAVGVGLLKSIPGDHRVEVTEMQLGNTFYAGARPTGITRNQVAASFLATRLAGAESSTGWLLNTRSQDFEAGEWGLLSDDDTIGDRAAGAGDAAAVLTDLQKAIGGWAAEDPEVLVLVSEESEAIELTMAMFDDIRTGRGPGIGITGATLLVVELLNMGVRARLAPVSAITTESDAAVLIVSHMIAWSSEFAGILEALVGAGSTVLFDATSGQFDEDASIHRPWPGHLGARIGLRSAGLDSAADGSAKFAVNAWKLPAGSAGSVRSLANFEGDAWSPSWQPSFAIDDSATIWQRSWGRGRFVYARFSLAVAALDPEAGQRVVREALSNATADLLPDLVPRTADAFVLSVKGDLGPAWGVFAGGEPYAPSHRITLDATPGRYVDLVTGVVHVVGAEQQLVLLSATGYAIIVPG